MKVSITIFLLSSLAILASCDVRSETAKKSMEKYTSSPTPPIPTPTPATPIDPADIVEVDVNQEGDTIFIDGFEQKKTASCTKFNKIMLNGDKNTVTIKGACRQIMINGDGNKVTADAAKELVFNGSENTLSYSRFANGKQPLVTENRAGNVIEKVSAKAVTNGKPQNKVVK
jgi:hypothetical protein